MAPISAAGAAESLLGPATEQDGLEKPGTKTRWRGGRGRRGGDYSTTYKDIGKSTSKARERQRTDVADVKTWQVDAVQWLNYSCFIAADILIRTWQLP